MSSSTLSTIGKVEPLTYFMSDPGNAFSSKKNTLHSLAMLASPLDPGTGAVTGYLSGYDEASPGDMTVEETQTPTETQIEQAKQDERDKIEAKKTNRRKTILTGSQGLLTPAPVERKTLLGQ